MTFYFSYLFPIGSHLSVCFIFSKYLMIYLKESVWCFILKQYHQLFKLLIKLTSHLMVLLWLYMLKSL